MRIDKIKNLIFRKIQVLPKNFIKTRFSLLPYKQSIRKTVVLRIDLFVYLSDFQALHYSEFLFFKVILRVTITVYGTFGIDSGYLIYLHHFFTAIICILTMNVFSSVIIFICSV